MMRNALSAKTIKKKVLEYKDKASTDEIIASFIRFFLGTGLTFFSD